MATHLPDQAPPAEPKQTAGSKLLMMAGGALMGVLLGVIGTFQHLHLWWVGAESSIGIPWGAALGLVMVLAALIWVGLATRSIFASFGLALGAYTAAVLLAFWPGDDQFSIPVNTYTWELLRWPVVAEVLWLAGLPILSVIGILIVSRHAKPKRRRPAVRGYNGDHAEPDPAP